MSDPADTTPRGGRALIAAAVDAATRARHEAHPVDTEHSKERFTAILEMLERELSAAWAEVGHPGFAGDDHPEWIKAMAAKMGEPAHQADLIFNILASVGFLFTGLSAAASGYNQTYTNRSLHAHGDLMLSVAEAAAAVTRNFLDDAQGVDQAAYSGMHPDRFQIIKELAENRVTPDQLVTLVRWGRLDLETAREYLAHLGYPVDQRELLLSFRVQPPDAAVVIAAVTQSEINDAQAMQFLEQNGIDPLNYPWIKETAGQSPGVELLNGLWQRGLISETLWTAGILESPIKNKYIEPLKNLRFHIPPMRVTLQMVANGIITPAKALDNLSKLGFYPEDAQALVANATREKTASSKDLAVGMIVDAYELKVIPVDEARTMLVALKYDPHEVDLVLAVADAKAHKKRTDQIIAKIRAQFIAYKITDQEASTALDRAQVPAAARNDLLASWDIERDTNIRHLTPAQIEAAVKKGLRDRPWGIAQLQGQGFSAADANLLLDLAVTPNPKAGTAA